MKTLLFLSVTCLLVAPAICNAQYFYPSYHASTAEEGAARGISSIIRSAGEANLKNSAAQKNWEEARAMNLDNRLKATSTYFEMKRMNREYREELRGERPTSEQLFRLAKTRLPDRVAPEQLDPLTGEIDWPTVLLQERFDMPRAQVNALFAQRARHDGYLPMEDIRALNEVLEEMHQLLRDQLEDLLPNDFLAGKKFLDGLKYEAHLGHQK